MLENTSTQLKTVWFFISRLFILAGMVLFFSALSLVLGTMLSKVIFGVDAFGDPSALTHLAENAEIRNAFKFLQVLITLGGMLIPAWYFPKAIGHESAAFLKLNTKVTLLHALYAIGLILLSIPMVSWLIEMNARLELPASWAALEAKLKATEEAAAKLTEAFTAGTSTGELVVNLLVVAVVPAIAEELLFRGTLQQFFALCFKNVHVAVLLSAALFSAFHGQVYGFMPRFVLGILLGYLFVYSGSVWPAILAHFINNTLSLLVAHFGLKDSSFAFLHDDYHFPIFLVCLSTAACAALVYFLSLKQPTTIPDDAEQLD
jgi:membrane protease YdiL (CAAX protease family)